MILFLQGVIKNMSLGERLRSLRIKNKLTQSELAENIMATNTSKGLSRPNRNMIALISKVFNVSPFELIGDYNLNDIEELKEKTKMN